MIRSILIPFLLLGGCADLPRDVEGTLDRVRAERRFTVGYADTADRASAAALVAEIERRTGARASAVDGPLERLLTEVEEGRMTMLIARFRDDSPWKTTVAFGLSLDVDHAGPRAHHLRPAMQNGENAWVGLVHRAAVAVGATPG